MIRRRLLALLERLCPSTPPDLLAECIDEPAAVIPAQRDPFEPVELELLSEATDLTECQRIVMACGRLSIAADLDKAVAYWSQGQGR